jgi:O-antigen/teichoic acid export membrane protein
VSVVVSILATVAEFGIGAAVVQAPSINRRELEQVGGLITLTNLGIFLLIVAAAPLLARAYRQEELTLLVQVAALQLPITSFGAITQAMAERNLGFRFIARVEMTSALISTAVALGLAWAGAGVWALVCGGLTAATTRTVQFVARDYVHPSFRLRGVGRFLPIGTSVMVGRLSWYLISQSDVLIGARRLGADAIGLYSVALHLATLPMQKVMGTVNAVALPAVARMQEDTARLRRRLIDATRLMTICSIPVMWGISAVAPELVRVVLGEKWAGAVLPVQLISMIVPLRIIHTIFSTTTVGIGRSRLNNRSTLVSAIVLPSAFFIGTFWGVNGLAAAWLFAIPLTFCFNFTRMARALAIEVSQIFSVVWRPAAAGAAMYLGIVAIRAGLGEVGELLRLPLLIAAGALIYVAVLHPLDRSVRGDLAQLLRAARS